MCETAKLTTLRKTGKEIFHVYGSIPFWLLLLILEFELRGFTFARQVLYCLSHASTALFHSGYF
jgi:hypothetical protein